MKDKIDLGHFTTEENDNSYVASSSLHVVNQSNNGSDTSSSFTNFNSNNSSSSTNSNIGSHNFINQVKCSIPLGKRLQFKNKYGNNM